jgi:hypothetical protein
MKSKKKLTITLSAIIFICIVYLFVRPYVFGRRFDSFIGSNSNKITRVYMINGSNGLNVSTTDRGKIEQIISLIDNRKYTKKLDQRDRDGFNYAMEFYVGDKKVLTLGNLGPDASVNGTRYYIDRPILVDDINSWFDSLPSVKYPQIAK